MGGGVVQSLEGCTGLSGPPPFWARVLEPSPELSVKWEAPLASLWCGVKITRVFSPSRALRVFFLSIGEHWAKMLQKFGFSQIIPETPSWAR